MRGAASVLWLKARSLCHVLYIRLSILQTNYQGMPTSHPKNKPSFHSYDGSDVQVLGPSEREGAHGCRALL